jgi:hypothetical protein
MISSDRRFGFRRWLAALARTAALLLVVQAMAISWLVSRARAHTAEALQGAGAHLASLAEGEPGSVHVLHVNGAEFKTVTLRTMEPVTRVLSAFRRSCGRLDLTLGEAVFELADDDEGVAVCFDAGISHSAGSLVRALERFVRTGELTVIGRLRYARVTRRDRRGTAVFLAWTEGPIRLFQMFPADRDAPGRDLPGIPRAPQSRRLLSSWEATQNSYVAVYATPLDEDAARRFYQTKLEQQGFHAYGASSAEARARRALLVTRGEQPVLLTFQSQAARGTLITVAAL